MTQHESILFKTLVKSFYRENAGLFSFIFIIMFFIVGQVEGAGILAYHYSLIIGILQSWSTLLLVLFVWLLYANKCITYVTTQLKRPEYSFLQIINSTHKFRQFSLFYVLEIWLLFPIILYAAFVVLIGIHQKYYLPVCWICLFFLLVSITATLHYVRVQNSVPKKNTFFSRIILGKRLISLYPFILLQYVLNEQKLLWGSIKLFACGLLYMIARNNTAVDYDNKTTFLVFSFSILANAILIYRIRAFEEQYISFYRTLGVTRIIRFLQYALVYGILLTPEFITLLQLGPIHLHYKDVVEFFISGYSLILLMTSITFIQYNSMKEYLKILLLLFMVQYFLLFFTGFMVSAFLFLTLAVIFFYTAYYRYEQID